MHPIWQCDELHVVSDLHLGGFDDRKIFGMTAELIRLLDYTVAQAANRRVGFVINGDFIDFLAARDARYFDPDGATDKLNRVLGDSTFSPIVGALRRVVAADRARLIINIGNHDLELALPWARERLLDDLSDGNDPARGRIVVETSGTGILAQVGNARVLCVHGNEVDDWNVTDHESIRRLGRDTQHGLAPQPWIPNAGAQLVIDVMNEIKRGKYPFVDLLKPETEGVVPALLALEPGLVTKIPSLVPAAGRKFWDSIRRAAGFLSGQESIPPGAPRTPATIGSPLMRQGRIRVQRERNARALLDATEQRLAAGDAPVDLLDAGDEARALGRTSALIKRAVTGDVGGALREALQPLAKDRSFSPFEHDDTYRDLDEAISGEIDILIAGHTHLERALPRKASRGFYYNTGTWARLIQLTEQDLASPESFAPFFNAVSAGTMKALDDAGVVLNRPTFASVWVEGGCACAELRRVRSAPATPVFEPATSDQRTLFRMGG